VIVFKSGERDELAIERNARTTAYPVLARPTPLIGQTSSANQADDADDADGRIDRRNVLLSATCHAGQS
jgi:hypothetical protein